MSPGLGSLGRDDIWCLVTTGRRFVSCSAAGDVGAAGACRRRRGPASRRTRTAGGVGGMAAGRPEQVPGAHDHLSPKSRTASTRSDRPYKNINDAHRTLLSTYPHPVKPAGISAQPTKQCRYSLRRPRQSKLPPTMVDVRRMPSEAHEMGSRKE